ncbi:MAG: nucleotidyltransferase family protein [Pirellulaceae bacterium]
MNSFAIIPAAGLSRRMGESKLLKMYRHKPLIQHTLEAWCLSRVDRVLVVIRADDHALQALLQNIGQRLSFNIVLADAPPEMKDSFWAGWTHLHESSELSGNDVILMAPADIPHLSSSIINQLLDFHPQHPNSILAPEYQGRRGHPALFPEIVAQAVSQLTSEQGLSALWEQFPHQSVAVDTDDSFRDFDTPQDWSDR